MVAAVKTQAGGRGKWLGTGPAETIVFFNQWQPDA
jgi:hypothetical protein